MPFIRFIARWTWPLFLTAVLFFNARLYAPTPLAPNSQILPPTLLAQLAANRKAIDSGSPADMQKLFPEGFYFCHVLHGLTWVEAALREPDLRMQAMAEAQKCIAALESAEGRAPFPSQLPPDHGMFYSAWKADLKAGIALLCSDSDDSDACRAGAIAALRSDCDAIAAAIEQSPSPFLASYTGSVWPCDTLPGIHAMVIHDHITGEDRYKSQVANWIEDAKKRLEPTTGLMPHMAGLPTGQPTTIARATSQVIILRFLADIDAYFAKQQYKLFREKFLVSFVGIPSVREYPIGTTGQGDVDSGPLIFGRSLSATVLMIAVAQIYGDKAQADAIARSGEVVGLPWTSHNEKRYVAGILPIGDIIVAYSQNARTWIGGTEHRVETPRPLTRFWRVPVHLISLCLLAPRGVEWWRRRRSSQLACSPAHSN